MKVSPAARWRSALRRGWKVAVGETAILLHSPLPVVGVSIAMERGCQQNDSLADGCCWKGLVGVLALAAGAAHSMALDTAGAVFTWGWNSIGQCGHEPEPEPEHEPEPEPELPPHLLNLPAASAPEAEPELPPPAATAEAEPEAEGEPEAEPLAPSAPEPAAAAKRGDGKKVFCWPRAVCGLRPHRVVQVSHGLQLPPL